jgi:hypothetical protein
LTNFINYLLSHFSRNCQVYKKNSFFHFFLFLLSLLFLSLLFLLFSFLPSLTNREAKRAEDRAKLLLAPHGAPHLRPLLQPFLSPWRPTLVPPVSLFSFPLPPLSGELPMAGHGSSNSNHGRLPWRASHNLVFLRGMTKMDAYDLPLAISALNFIRNELYSLDFAGFHFSIKLRFDL